MGKEKFRYCSSCHFVVVEGLCTCQVSHLTQKPRAGQGSPLRVAPGGPMGYERGPYSFAACRDEKLMNVSDVKAFDEERTWVNRVTCEIVFQPATGAPRGACAAVREKLNLHPRFYQQDVNHCTQTLALWYTRSV